MGSTYGIIKTTTRSNISSMKRQVTFHPVTATSNTAGNARPSEAYHRGSSIYVPGKHSSTLLFVNTSDTDLEAESDTEDPNKRKEPHRLRNKSTNGKGKKILLQGYKTIDLLCKEYHLPEEVADGAKHLFKDAEESNYFRGKNVVAIAGSCVYLYSRTQTCEVSFRKITKRIGLDREEIGRAFKQLETFCRKERHAEDMLAQEDWE